MLISKENLNFSFAIQAHCSLRFGLFFMFCKFFGALGGVPPVPPALATPLSAVCHIY